MAALTAATVLRESNGSLTLHKITFSSVTTGDTWASGLPNVIGAWANVTSGTICTATVDTATSASTIVSANGISVIESSGTFTLYPSANAVPVTLNIWSKT